MRTHELGMSIRGKVIWMTPLFWHSVRLTREAPLVHVAPTRELEYPYRTSQRSLILKLTRTRGIVLGWWKESGMNEYDHLMAAIDWQEKGKYTPKVSLVKGE